MVTRWNFLRQRARDRTSEWDATKAEEQLANATHAYKQLRDAYDDAEPQLADEESGVYGAASMQSRKPSVKLSLEVTPEVNDVLLELVKQTHASGKSEVLRKAIALMKVAVDAKKDGKKIGIAEKDQPLATEIVGL